MGDDELAGWDLTVGYPDQIDPVENLTVRLIELPAGSLIAEWAAGIFLRITLTPKAAHSAIAHLIENIMMQLHGITHQQLVEVALEADS